MANWFCSVFNVVCVVNVCPVHAVDLNELTMRGLSLSLDKKMHKKNETQRSKVVLKPANNGILGVIINYIFCHIGVQTRG